MTLVVGCVFAAYTLAAARARTLVLLAASQHADQAGKRCRDCCHGDCRGSTVSMTDVARAPCQFVLLPIQAGTVGTGANPSSIDGFSGTVCFLPETRTCRGIRAWRRSKSSAARLISRNLPPNQLSRNDASGVGSRHRTGQDSTVRGMGRGTLPVPVRVHSVCYESRSSDISALQRVWPW